MLEEDEVPLANSENVAPIFVHGLQTAGDYRLDKDIISNLLGDVFSPELFAIEPVLEVKRRTKIESDKVVRSFEVRLALWCDRELILRKAYQLNFFAATKSVYISEDNQAPIASTTKKPFDKDRSVSTVLVRNEAAASSYDRLSSGNNAVRFVYKTKENSRKVSQNTSKQGNVAVETKKSVIEYNVQKNARQSNRG